jgi:hypothetical protein
MFINIFLGLILEIMSDTESLDFSIEALDLAKNNNYPDFYEVREVLSWIGSEKCYLRGLIDPQSWQCIGQGSNDYTFKLYDVVDPSKFIILSIANGHETLEERFHNQFVPYYLASNEWIEKNSNRWDDDWETKNHEVVVQVRLYNLGSKNKSKYSNGTVDSLFIGVDDFEDFF